MNITPVITKNEMAFVWNVDEIKKQLADQLEKYNNLVVTEDNYEDMAKAKREIVKFRTTIKAFGDEQKRILKTPYDKFVGELKEVLLEVERVEKPLADQLTYFEEKEMREKQAKIEEIIAEKIELYGLREEYHHLIDRDSRWWRNKTFKIAEAAGVIDEQIKNLKQRQQNDDDMRQIEAEKRGMLEFAFDMMSSNYDLATPLDFEPLYDKVKDMPINQAKQFMQFEFNRRLNLEQAAREQVVSAEEAFSDIEDEPEAVELTTEERTYTVIVKGLWASELKRLEGYLQINDIEYEVK